MKHAVFAVLLAACAKPPPALIACPKQHAGATAEGDSVIICDELFAEAPRVRLPADEPGILHGAISGMGGGFHDRDGRRYQLLGAGGQPISVQGGSPAVNAPEWMRVPYNRELFTLYEVRGTVDGDTIAITALEPIVLLSPAAIDGAYTTFEGSVSLRNGPGAYELDRRARIRIELSSWTEIGKMDDGLDYSATLADGGMLIGAGEIVNASERVRASDGTCLPALSELSVDENPFFGAAGADVGIHRWASMHGPGDNVIVLEYPRGVSEIAPNGMSNLSLWHPRTFISLAPAMQPVSIWPHGTPNGHNVELAPVSSSAREACSGAP